MLVFSISLEEEWIYKKTSSSSSSTTTASLSLSLFFLLNVYLYHCQSNEINSNNKTIGTSDKLGSVVYGVYKQCKLCVKYFAHRSNAACSVLLLLPPLLPLLLPLHYIPMHKTQNRRFQSQTESTSNKQTAHCSFACVRLCITHTHTGKYNTSLEWANETITIFESIRLKRINKLMYTRTHT